MLHHSSVFVFAILLGIGILTAADAPKNEPKLKIMKNQFPTLPAKNFDPKAEGIIIIDAATICRAGVRIEDDSAPEGKAVSHSEKKKEAELENLHNGGFIFGFYEKKHKKMLQVGYVLAKHIPQDGKYHWYHLGTMPIYSGSVLWMHKNWGLSAELGNYVDVSAPDREYRIYGLLKFQGPGYVKNSKQRSDIRLAQIALLPIEK